MRFRYFDPLQQSVVEGDVSVGSQVAALVEVVSALRADCVPALELTGTDGASMVLGVDHDRAVVLWTSADGTTRHSIGGRGSARATFDWFGTSTQMPGHYAVPLASALAAAGGWVDGSTGGSTGGSASGSVDGSVPGETGPRLLLALD